MRTADLHRVTLDRLVDNPVRLGALVSDHGGTRVHRRLRQADGNPQTETIAAANHINDIVSTATTPKAIDQRYAAAQAVYADLGIDTDQAIDRAAAVPISLHCWQMDDVNGFEKKTGPLEGGGIMATGNYPGRARNGDEMRQDFDKVLALLPGKQRLNLHGIYAEIGTDKVDRDGHEPKHFQKWIDWAKARKIGLDFNPSYFAHPKANDGMTLAHRDKSIRDFWIRHGIASRKIAQAIGRELNDACINNHWVPDGLKDSPADRWSPRARLVESLDEILSTKHGISAEHCVDAVEGKLFGLASEDYVVGSHELYSHYALTRNVVLCLDMGHFHPTETIADKLSAFLQFHKRLLLHVSRPIRWDSDHVVIFNDDIRAVFQELVRGDGLDRVVISTDFFDASLNRVAAYVIGARATRKAVLYALLEPISQLREYEAAGKTAQKLGLMEELKTLPFGAVWDELCLRTKVPVGTAWINEMEKYETKVLAARK